MGFVIHLWADARIGGMKTIALLLTVFALFLIGCGGGSDSSSSSESTAPSAATGGGAPSSESDGGGSGGGAKAVTIADYMYKPASLTVPVGTTVKFTNEDSTPHTATSRESGAFDSGSIETGKSGEIKLEKAGTFAYYCVFHPFMKGTITVK
jgi:plastocyanin